MEARRVQIFQLRNRINIDGLEFDPADYEQKTSGWLHHPTIAPLPEQISLLASDPLSVRPADLHIYTDGSKQDAGVGSAYVCYRDNLETYTWMTALRSNNSVFQAENFAIKKAIEYAQLLSTSINIYSDSLSCLAAILDPSSPHLTSREISLLLHNNPNIHVYWLKGHAGNLGNERADELAKQAASLPPGDTLLPWPKSWLNSQLISLLKNSWQEQWGNGDTGRLVFDLIPVVSLHPQNWSREIIMFLTEHGPFPLYFKRFNLREHNLCACGGVGKAIHYATDCSLTASYHMSAPSEDFLIEWKKKILTNKLTRKRTENLMRFLLENHNLIIPPI